MYRAHALSRFYQLILVKNGAAPTQCKIRLGFLVRVPPGPIQSGTNGKQLTTMAACKQSPGFGLGVSHLTPIRRNTSYLFV